VQLLLLFIKAFDGGVCTVVRELSVEKHKQKKWPTEVHSVSSVCAIDHICFIAAVSLSSTVSVVSPGWWKVVMIARRRLHREWVLESQHD